MRLVFISELSRYCHPQTKFAKVMFLRVSVSHSIQGGVVSQHAMQVVSQHALQVFSGGGIPACLADLQATPRGKLRGLVWGSPCHSQGGSWGVWPEGCLQAHTQGGGGVSRPTPRGVSRPTPRGLQAHTQGGGGVSRPTPGGCPGPHLRGSQGLHPGGYPSMHWGRHPQQTATAAGSMHHTGMHSCLQNVLQYIFWDFST